MNLQQQEWAACLNPKALWCHPWWLAMGLNVCLQDFFTHFFRVIIFSLCSFQGYFCEWGRFNLSLRFSLLLFSSPGAKFHRLEFPCLRWFEQHHLPEQNPDEFQSVRHFWSLRLFFFRQLQNWVWEIAVIFGSRLLQLLWLIWRLQLGRRILQSML